MAFDRVEKGRNGGLENMQKFKITGYQLGPKRNRTTWQRSTEKKAHPVRGGDE